jgi:nucleotide-binding universal stress UspA family protein
VIKTAQGDRHRKELGVFGTTTTALMRKATCPVWVVDPEQFHGLQRILVTVDPSTDDPEKMKLNVQSVNLAAELAESTGASLYVLYAWLALGESLLWRTGMSEDALRKYFNDSRLYARIEMANLLAQCDKRISSSNVYLVKGDRHEVIADFAAQRRINLIVMGTVGRTGIGGVVIGNTAEKVLQRVHCSVLTIRPGALVSRARTADGQGSQMPHSDSASKFFKPKVAVHPRPVSCEPRRRPPGRTAGQITNGRQHSTHCAFTYEHRLGSIAESHGHSSNDTLGTDRQMPK